MCKMNLDIYKKECINRIAREIISENIREIEKEIEISPMLEETIWDIFDDDGTLTDSLDMPNTSPINNTAAGRHIINTYPFGVPTDIISTELLAACGRGMSLKKTLSYIVNFCKIMNKHHPQENKTVVLLTDKWDNYVFSEFEIKLINFFNQNNFNFAFFLVSDYGMTRIPFLNIKQYNRRPNIVVTEGDSVFTTNLNTSKQDKEMIIYSYDPYNGWRIGNPRESIKIIIDVADKTCTINGKKVGRVTDSALYHLLRRLEFLKNYSEDELNPQTIAIDHDRKTFKMNNTFVDMMFCKDKSVSDKVEMIIQIFLKEIGVK